MLSNLKKLYEKAHNLLAKIAYFRNEIGYHPFSEITLSLNTYYGTRVYEGESVKIIGRLCKPKEDSRKFIMGEPSEILILKEPRGEKSRILVCEIEPGLARSVLMKKLSQIEDGTNIVIKGVVRDPMKDNIIVLKTLEHIIS